MRISIDWLRDFVDIDSSPTELAEELTLAGLEVDSVEPVAPEFAGVVVAQILEKRPHPNADRLSLCRITDGTREHEIVCGAPNAAAGLKVPFAPAGTLLPGGLKIEAARIRGIDSAGMLCSARELGLTDDPQGLLVLDAAAVPGEDLRELLALNDHVLEIDLTPNRGDCFSVLGIAREVAARRGADPIDESLDCIEPGPDQSLPVELVDTAACPRFAGRVITGLNASARSPDWLRERLRRAGLRAIHPVVDVTNYVMLEFGQPLHAYRLDSLSGGIQVRFGRAGESLRLLNNSDIEIDPATLVIADESGPIGLAGIMGGLATAVDASTNAIFLESAFFAPSALQGRARRYGLHTDASVRFERGVDPSGQERALERATQLLVGISGGAVGPIIVAEDEGQIPTLRPIRLRAQRIASRLGVDVSEAEVVRRLGHLGMQVEAVAGGWEITPPSYRFDISIEDDLIEEIGRLVGYDRIPARPGQSAVHPGRASEAAVSLDSLGDLLVARGYTEIVNYGFTSASAQASMLDNDGGIRLANPLTQELDALRSSLWPGLLRAARLNFSHQITRCQLFETGTVFESDAARVVESTHLAGLLCGSRGPLHWEGASPAADFFDLKGDVEALLSLWRRPDLLRFESASHATLNPSRSAAIALGERAIGWIGELHPRLQLEYELKHPVLLFAIDLSSVGLAGTPRFSPYSRFPSVRRDLALIVDEKLAAADLTKLVAEVLGDALRHQEIFDLYRGQGVDNGRKSVGMGLILQDASRTLTDKEADDMIQQVVRRLEHELGARIRN
jgi:phenylalanyl-tRNA synthetase beta chain